MALRYDTPQAAARDLGLEAIERLGLNAETEQAPKAPTVPSLPPASLGVLVCKAKHYGGSVIRQGIATLQFSLRPGEWVTVECLTNGTWVSIYQEGALKSRKGYAPMSAFELLQALQFDSILL